jgi:hypothetical protein
MVFSFYVRFCVENSIIMEMDNFGLSENEQVTYAKTFD